MSKKSRIPWKTARGVDAVVEDWLESRIVKPCLTADETVPGREAKTAPLPPGLPSQLAFALRGRGVSELYEHQARAFTAARDPRTRALVVATPTASGKSYCFHLPVLSRMLENRDARALYLYPTKALARDQEAGLREIMRAAGLEAGAVVYDGDTPGDARRAARERTGIVLTNPDMLHAGILPHHTAWARTFQNLAYVVVDELHTYKGVFGSHVANVLRRLMRVAKFHGSNPVLIGATATIGNPREHAARIFGIDLTREGADENELVSITENGAPQGERRVFMFNPPVVNAELGIRASYVKQAVMLATDLVRAHVPTIVFGQSRNNVEVMLRYLRDKVAPDIDASRIMGYRGGYLPEQRREIERKLRAGEVLCVVATNALELGIDIGGLDAVICAGYPGSVAATWQRFGRAGRRGERSICVLVTSSAPLDQYLAREPEYLLGAPVEEARIDADNPEIVIQHLKCGAFELPFRRGERYGTLDASETSAALEFLVAHKVLHESNDTFHWAADAYPANNVSLRSIGWDNVVIIDAEHDKTIAEIDWRGAHTMVHEQAIYQHDGECWQVEKFDYENHKAFVRKVKPDYWTDAMTYTTVSVLEEFGTGPAAVIDPPHPDPWPTGWGEVSVVEKVVGYKKIKFYTHENAGYGDVRLPEMQMHTTSFWLTVPESVCMQIPQGRAAAIDGLRGAGIALETVATLALMCDPRDLGCTLGDTALDESGNGDGVDGDAARQMDWGASSSSSDAPPVVPRKVRGGPAPGYSPTLFLYEHTPGGIGLAERIFEQREVLIARALRLVEGCPCDFGCPACVGPNAGLDVPPAIQAQLLDQGSQAAPESGVSLAAIDANDDTRRSGRRDRPRPATGRKAIAIDILRRAARGG
ncbi:MAG: box helicase protein [Myxococcales bacterium]|nr:box helicase protein [Myxococcales bacterium]